MGYRGDEPDYSQSCTAKGREEQSQSAKRGSLIGHKEETHQRQNGSTHTHRNSLPREIMESPFFEVSEVSWSAKLDTVLKLALLCRQCCTASLPDAFSLSSH